jgi:hypothetical protein
MPFCRTFLFALIHGIFTPKDRGDEVGREAIVIIFTDEDKGR